MQAEVFVRIRLSAGLAFDIGTIAQFRLSRARWSMSTWIVERERLDTIPAAHAKGNRDIT